MPVPGNERGRGRASRAFLKSEAYPAKTAFFVLRALVFGVKKDFYDFLDAFKNSSGA